MLRNPSPRSHGYYANFSIDELSVAVATHDCEALGDNPLARNHHFVRKCRIIVGHTENTGQTTRPHLAFNSLGLVLVLGE